MKPLRLTALALLAAILSGCSTSLMPQPDFREHLGLQLYSLRGQFPANSLGLGGTLDLAKSYGIKEVETYGISGVTAGQLATELKARGLVAVSAHVGANLFRQDIAKVIADAKTLGVKYVVIPTPPLQGNEEFTEQVARTTAASFNEWGAALKKEGLQLGYHPHGREFRPTAAGNGETSFDVLVRETNPDLVTFELDVFWAYLPGQDPVKLLEKYPNRWSMIHIKDMLKGYARGVHTGAAPPTAKVTVGTGQIDYPAILRTAQKIGIKHYLLEDETPTPLQTIPDSFKYLRELKL
jgi:sugar phosphate isomerase/epimerase